MQRAILSSCLVVVSSVAIADDETSREELREQIKQLTAQIEQLQEEVVKLSEIVEGTAQPINLGRTNFAAVAASNVNGGRPLSNKFYGVQNAFDDGENWHNGINYTYWLATGGSGHFVDVFFDHPVTVTGIDLEGESRTTPTFKFAKGGEQTHKAFQGKFQPPAPLHGVEHVRLSVADSPQNVQINEIRVMGYPHPEVKYKVTRPRLHINEAGAISAAKEKLQEAGFSPQGVTHRVVEHMDRWEVVFRHEADDVDLFRVTVFKRQAKIETEKLARFAPIED